MNTNWSKPKLIVYPAKYVALKHKSDRTGYDTPGSISGCPCESCNSTRRTYKQKALAYYEQEVFYISVTPEGERMGIIYHSEREFKKMVSRTFSTRDACENVLREKVPTDYLEYFNVVRESRHYVD